MSNPLMITLGWFSLETGITIYNVYKYNLLYGFWKYFENLFLGGIYENAELSPSYSPTLSSDRKTP